MDSGIVSFWFSVGREKRKIFSIFGVFYLRRWVSATIAIYKLIPDNDKGSFDCRQVYRRGYSTYNVDDRERRCRNDYITATHNVNKKICWRSTTLCVTNGASAQTPHRFWYDSQSVCLMVNWWRIDSMNFPGTGLVMQWAEDAEHPGRLNGFCQEYACVLERKLCAYSSFFKMPKIISN